MLIAIRAVTTRAIILASSLLLALLAACGGGGGGGGNPPPADKLTLSGTVLNGSTPLAGALVQLGLGQTSTDSQGRFSFANLSAGQYTVSLQSGPNFSSLRVNLSTSTTSFEFQLPESDPQFRVDSVAPVLSSTPQALSTDIAFGFNSNVAEASVTLADFRFSPDIGSFEVFVEEDVVTLVPRLQLPLNQTIVVEIIGAISSTTGASLRLPVRFFFRTTATDTAAPVLIEARPATGATNVPTNALLRLEYNELLQLPDAGAAASAIPATDLTLTAGNRFLSVRAPDRWQPNTSYTVQVQNPTDLAGNSAAGFTFTFTTGTQAAAVRNIEPHWNRVADLIVFASDQAGSFDIWSIRPNGTELTQLTSGADDETSPSLSSDGLLLAYQARGLAGDYDIFVGAASNGDAALAVTTAPYDDTQPAFSRTFSRSVFFVSNRTEPPGLYRVESNGAALTALDPTFGSNQFDPAPHPLLDTQLLFTSGRSGSNDIWRKTLSVIDDTVININLTEDLLAQDRMPDWAPDASYIVYISNRGGSDNIWLTDAAGTLPRQVTNFEQPVSDPAVSPFAGEARCAAALRNPDGSSDIVIIDLVGGTVITNLTGESGG